MIWIFTCPTQGCDNNINPVYLVDPTNPVECSLCHAYGDAVETDEPAPAPQPEKTAAPAPKSTKGK
jgi:hypothetical protein